MICKDIWLEWFCSKKYFVSNLYKNGLEFKTLIHTNKELTVRLQSGAMFLFKIERCVAIGLRKFEPKNDGLHHINSNYKPSFKLFVHSISWDGESRTHQETHFSKRSIRQRWRMPSCEGLLVVSFKRTASQSTLLKHMSAHSISIKQDGRPSPTTVQRWIREERKCRRERTRPTKQPQPRNGRPRLLTEQQLHQMQTALITRLIGMIWFLLHLSGASLSTTLLSQLVPINTFLTKQTEGLPTTREDLLKSAGLKVKKKNGDDGVWPQIVSRYKRKLGATLIKPTTMTAQQNLVHNNKIMEEFLAEAQKGSLINKHWFDQKPVWSNAIPSRSYGLRGKRVRMLKENETSVHYSVLVICNISYGVKVLGQIRIAEMVEG